MRLQGCKRWQRRKLRAETHGVSSVTLVLNLVPEEHIDWKSGIRIWLTL